MGKNLGATNESGAGGVRLSFAAVLLVGIFLWLSPAVSATSEKSASAIASLNAGTAAIQSGRALEAIDYFNNIPHKENR